MDGTPLYKEDLEESVEVILAGYQRKSAVIPQEKRIVACMRFDHALVAARREQLRPSNKNHHRPPHIGSLGYTMQVDEGEKEFLMSRDEI